MKIIIHQSFEKTGYFLESLIYRKSLKQLDNNLN